MSVWVGKVSLLIMTSFRGFLALLLVPAIAAVQLKIRVDDDVAVYQNGEAVINSHAIPGWQWTTVYDADFTADVLVLTAWNQGGPGGILIQLDGEAVPLDKWKCARLDNQGQANPETKYPGSLSNDFDDSTWGPAVSVNNAWGNTAGFTGAQQWFWGGPQSDKMVVCRMRIRDSAPAALSECVYPEAKNRALKIRVDDDVAVYQGSQTVVNSHTIPGWQWTTVYDATITTNLIVLTAWNQGGPGGILLTIDGETPSLDQWKCNTMSSQGENPETAYPGVLGLDFDDSTWGNAVSVNNAWGNTAGFANNNAWFWTNPTSAKMAICRMKLEECAIVEPTEAPTPAIDPTEAPTPVIDPTEAPIAPTVTAAPTEAPTCVKQRASWAESDIPVDEPALTEDCQFELKQCNAEKCFCVSAKKGNRAFDPVEVPLGESYDCSKKPKKCQKKRFNLLIKGKSGLIPVCAKSGHYETKQCHEGECWCVKPKGGKERKNTRTTGDLKC